MNTTMADGASERLDAQIADALFGQPGMSKTDVTNRLRELRGAGSPLLADARIPNSPSPAGQADVRAQFEAWHCEKFKTHWQTGAPTRDMHNGVLADKYGPAEQQARWDLWQAAWQAAIAARPVDLAPRAMETTPRDGTMVRLLVQFEENATEDTAEPAWTIGACNDDNVGEDERIGWQFAGWCWTHDHFTEGKGTPVGWLPLIDSKAVGDD